MAIDKSFLLLFREKEDLSSLLVSDDQNDIGSSAWTAR
jgi:hypothetical protein